MQLICKYDTEFPYVVGHVSDDVVIDLGHDDAVKGCVVIPCSETTIEAVVKLYGKAGPEPELMGAPPTQYHPTHAELDKADVPDHVLADNGKPKLDAAGAPVPHPLRVNAGKPYKDNRRLAEDLRLPAAPPESDPAVLKAYLGHRRWQLETAGLRVGEVDVATDRESQYLIETLSSRAARRSDTRVDFRDARGVVHSLDTAAVVDIGDTVFEHAQRLRSAAARVETAVDAGEVRCFADVEAALRG